MSTAAHSREPLQCRLVDGRGPGFWTAFIESHPGANLGHAYEWRHVMESAYGKRCYYLVALEGNRCRGVLPLVHMEGLLSDQRLVSLPFLDQAGILAETEEVRWRLLEAAVALAGRVSAKGLELRAPARDAGGNLERATLVLALPGSTEALWKTFKPKVRNQVRKAEKLGVRARRAPAERLPEFYRVFCENMRDLGSPVHGYRFFKGILDAFGCTAMLYLAEDERARVVGGAVALRFRDTVTVPWASSLREVFSWCPNHALYWQILQDSIDGGAAVFDFGRSWLGSGTYHFKKQWGAVPRPLEWSAFDATGRPEAVHGYRPGDHGVLVRLWSRLPRFVTNSLGPVLRGQLSN